MITLDPQLHERAIKELLQRQPPEVARLSDAQRRQQAEEELQAACEIIRTDYHRHRDILSQRLCSRSTLSGSISEEVMRQIIAAEEHIAQKASL